MNTALLMNFLVDKKNKKISVEREFDAQLDLVWDAWTQSKILDKWWAPKPWRAETKAMKFQEGGYWHYSMVGPEGERQWCLVEYETIKPHKSFTSLDGFCDENRKMSDTMPRMHWEVTFTDNTDTTVVNIEVSFDKLADLETIIEMGFKEGFTMGLENLDHYISTQFRLRKENKTSNKARVTTYLNFPGNTEEAFNFYRKVFNGKFTGRGLQRFGDIEAPAGAPPMSEADKKLIIHAELTIMGGHVLMATDAPESMGFKLQQGNNIFINLEPESREETKRLFDKLSEGGTVTMPLEDMFWGGYFASFTDKFGINWMLNYQAVDSE